MKKLKSVFALALSVLVILCAMPVIVVSAEETTSDGFVYEAFGNEVTITDYTGSKTNLTIPEKIDGKSVTEIGFYAFGNCESLKSITIPEGVESIGNSAFSWCRSLKSIIIPEGVESIGNFAFDYCDSLESITIPDSVESIGNYAFRGCKSLESITIPESVKSIGNSAFSSCDELTDIYYDGTEEQWDELMVEYLVDSDQITATVHCNRIDNTNDTNPVTENGDDANTPENQSDNKEKAIDNDDYGSYIIMLASILGGAVLLVGISVCVIIVLAKKKKSAAQNVPTQNAVPVQNFAPAEPTASAQQDNPNT